MIYQLFVLIFFTFVAAYPHLNMADLEKKLTDEHRAMLTAEPNMKMTEKLGEMKAVAGEAVMMRCEILSTPYAIIFWQKDGNIIQGTTELNQLERIYNYKNKTVEGAIVSSTYYIPCATQEDAGVYSCVARTEFDEISTVGVLQIEGEHRQCPSTNGNPPLITMQTESRFEMNGNTATLSCRADQKVNWTWKFEEMPLSEDDEKYLMLNNGDLLVHNIEWADMGDYFCIGSNENGVAKGETFLYPTKKV